MEGSSKRAGEALEQESTKKQKVDEDKSTTELQSLMEVILDEEEVAIDAIPLATKPLSIIEWKIHKEGKKSYYQIIRADGNSQMYKVFSQMLKSFSKEDLKDLYKLVRAKYKSTRPVEDLELVLWNDLKNMFEPNVEDEVWKLQQRYSVVMLKLLLLMLMLMLLEFENASKSLDKLIECQIVDNCKKCLGYNAVPPPHTRKFMPPTPDLSFIGLDEFANKPIVKNCQAKTCEEEPKVEPKAEPKIQVSDGLVPKETDFLSNVARQFHIWILQDQGSNLIVISRHMTGNMSYLTDYEEIDGGYVAFYREPQRGKSQENVSLKLLIDESQVLLRVPRKNNMYSVDLKNIVAKGVVTDDFSRFTWVFFLATKDETSGILKSFITRIENLIDHKVKVIRCDNETEFKNKEMNHFCNMKGIVRQFSVARTPQQNGVAERRNRILIEPAKTMLANSKLLTTFWAKAVSTACYVQNRVLVVKPHNKTPYELFHARTPTLSFMRPFGCPVTILNTIDHLGKFDGKADEGFFVGYSLNSKAFRVFNSRTRIVKENLHIRFRENIPNVVGSEPDWLFNIDALTITMNYEPIVIGTLFNGFADPKSSQDDGSKPSSDDGKKVHDDPREESESNDQEKDDNVKSTNNVNAASINEVIVVSEIMSIELPNDPNMPALEDVSILEFSSNDEDVGSEADINNMDTTIQVRPIPTTRIHKDHPIDQVIGDLQSATQIRRMTKNLEEHGFVSTIQERTNHKDLQLLVCLLFITRRTQKGHSSIEGSKLDRGYAGRASTIQVIRSFDLSGFTKWKKGYRHYDK
ncbi:putative ribonuclease H-like domain-containing protein, partial [Tanacetum coccineum]